jgi:hypothetical protein
MLLISALLGVIVSLPTTVDKGYAAMYNLDFSAAHRDFQQWRHDAPQDPMGPVGDAAAYLFSEFARLHVLEAEFFTDDQRFTDREHGLKPDQAAKAAFESALAEGQKLAASILARSPDDENALLASVLAQGLHADYLALIERRNLAALKEIKQGRQVAERLLQNHPQCYDAYLAIGVENYMLSLKPAPVRWLLRFSGAQTDKDTGIQRLKLTAEHGRYLQPYARLLLAVAALRDGNRTEARNLLTWLASKFPGNPLYRAELQKLR